MGVLVSAVTILGLWQCFVGGSVLHEKMTVVQDPNDKQNVVVVTWMDENSNDVQCQMFTDPKLIHEVLSNSGEKSIHRPTKEEMQEIREECNSLSLNRRRRETEEEDEEDDEMSVQQGPDAPGTFNWIGIFPGTKWCGAGDMAKHDDDLGFHEDTDRCCRAHDKCDDLILAGETKYNLTNKSPFTKLSCKCDYDFYDCLSRINSVTSNTVGNSYFNVLRSQCYAKDYPLSKKCKKYRTFLKITCQEYEKDTSKPQVYRWFKAKFYKQIPFPGPLTVTLPF